MAETRMVKTVEQRRAELKRQQDALDAREMKDMAKLGYILGRAKNLPQGKREMLAALLFEVNPDAGDQARLARNLGVVVPTPAATPKAE